MVVVRPFVVGKIGKKEKFHGAVAPRNKPGSLKKRKLYSALDLRFPTAVSCTFANEPNLPQHDFDREARSLAQLAPVIVRNRLFEISNQFARLPNQPPDLPTFRNGTATVESSFECIFISKRCAGPWRATMHTTSFLPADSGRSARSTGAGPRAAAWAGQHRHRVAPMKIRHWRGLTFSRYCNGLLIPLNDGHRRGSSVHYCRVSLRRWLCFRHEDFDLRCQRLPDLR